MNPITSDLTFQYLVDKSPRLNKGEFKLLLRIISTEGGYYYKGTHNNLLGTIIKSIKTRHNAPPHYKKYRDKYKEFNNDILRFIR
jgi:hypothetical protein